MNELEIIGRNVALYVDDWNHYENKIRSVVENSSFLIIGGAGTIGQATTKEIFSKNPKKLHVVDISENNLVELVRDLRSSFGYIDGEFKTFAIDCGTSEFFALLNNSSGYDYVLNLSAMKHVRSEKDAFTLMRLIKTNIFNTNQIINHPMLNNAKHFCVSTDKAANPVNMMGASKNIMELFVLASDTSVSMARFANVAFSDGSLLHGFNMRIEKQQPISAPNDVERYFVTKKEAGELCVLACILGGQNEIFFPKPTKQLKLTKFSDIAIRFLSRKGLEPIICKTEDEARRLAKDCPQGFWPCYFFESDTTGEKAYEEFFTAQEQLELNRFQNIGVVTSNQHFKQEELDNFITSINRYETSLKWTKEDLLEEFRKLLPEFHHEELSKNLDQRM